MPGLSVNTHPFGKAPDGTPVERWVLRAPSGFGADILTYGATLHSCQLPSLGACTTEAVLSLPSVDAYAQGQAYLGAVVGRYANRIAGGCFTLDGATHRLQRNEGLHTLNGGSQGFHRRVWSASGILTADCAGVALRLRSPDGDMGFPGNLDVEVVYRIDTFGTLAVECTATSDRPTVVNLTQHAYWNLAQSESIADHELTVESDEYLPVDAARIPLGPPAATANTPFALGRRLDETLTAPHPQIAAAGGLDHCFVLRGGTTRVPRKAARLSHAGSGHVMEVWTTEPGMQVYTANTLGAPFIRHQAVCLEPQHFPDAPNRPDYPPTVLRPGQTYASITEYRFDQTARASAPPQDDADGEVP